MAACFLAVPLSPDWPFPHWLPLSKPPALREDVQVEEVGGLNLTKTP